MGLHYFNRALVDDLDVDPHAAGGPGVCPGPDGKLRLRRQLSGSSQGPDLWTDPPGATSPPSVFGMPMRILVPAVGFYTHHAWVWKRNPSGNMADLNPEVVCQ